MNALVLIARFFQFFVELFQSIINGLGEVFSGLGA